MPVIAFLHSLIRKEEKLLLDQFSQISGIEVDRINVKTHPFEISKAVNHKYDIAFERAVSFSQGLNAARILESNGLLVINSAQIIQTCGDKLLTTLSLKEKNIKQPEAYLSHSIETTINISENMGYPVVFKPLVGSWGRLLAKVNDREAAEAILEHKSTLGDYQHSSFYIQNYIEKDGNDIRAFVIGDECVAAIYRKSQHWITNTSRGAVAVNCEVSEELNEISVKAANAVNYSNSPSLLAVDVMEQNNELLINEVNATMEFRNSIETTGVNIPKLMTEYIVDAIRR